MTTAFNNAVALKVFGISITHAQDKAICVACKADIRDERVAGKATGEPGQIYSSAGMQEYRTSGLCETCYDSLEA